MNKVYVLGGEGKELVLAAFVDKDYGEVELFFVNDVDELNATIGKLKKICGS